MNKNRLFGACVAVTLSLLGNGVILAAEAAEKLEVTVEIPQLNVGGYHRPYVAVWVQDADAKVVQNVAVWYQLKGKKKGSGTKWLPDLRQWWRRSGRELEMPVDGISGATRPVGKHELTIDSKAALAQLKPGQYALVVEAAREHGGRELVKVPFSWPATAEQSYAVSGEKELGEVTLTVRP
ncbi:DUF2271 domain-containing protein [Blastopirellula marina]|uniref:DUF2271 domain-containing protein n=1 Tax=Blastopirellula marina DSM 3645 TaxID=314230 RepID=A3ZQ47_9BACT|nr:DUF2271 domain-containing protein [Blastopirellula marina]EAQ81320.1 hypothetical protein DSM3645_23051 [Blastopirellula marina DSM 3645]